MGERAPNDVPGHGDDAPGADARAGDASSLHQPVALAESFELLAPALRRDGAVLVDATLGLGGHAEHFLSRLPELRLVGIDRDADALRLAAERLAPFADRVTLVHTTYDRIADALAAAGVAEADGILADLGVSSMQLDQAERGFAYMRDADLDMRMDTSTGPTAAEVVATYPAGELTRILRAYGEERHARRIVDAIVRAREAGPIETTGELSSLVIQAYPPGSKSGHPSKRTFQALRIEVNDELGILARFLPAACESLAVGGRIVVLSYQSLEDRMVKQEFARRSRADVPVDLPVIPADSRPRFTLLTRGAQVASEEEAARNPRASSVRIRAAERVAAEPTRGPR